MTVWNFAFGSNMNPKALVQRRKITPSQSVPGAVKDWKVTFQFKGFPFMEPAFGNIEQSPGSVAYGVAHEMTDEVMVIF
jgi:hypothetical protein